MSTVSKNIGQRLTSSRLALLVFLPATVLMFTVFVILPMVNAVTFSFYDWNGFGPKTDFVGLENYEDVLTHRHFPTAVRNSLIILAASLLIQLPLAMWVSVALIEKSAGVTMLRVLFFIPFMLAEVAAGLIWRFVFDGDYGILPAIGDGLGTELPYVLGDKVWVMPAIVLVVVWKYFGFHMMIYIAALQSISKEVIEAARLDGVSKWQIILFVKIPMIKSAIIVSVFLAVIGALQLFDLIFPLTKGGPANSSNTIVSFLYQFGITRMKLGFGGAVSVILFIGCVVTTLIFQRITASEKT